MLSTLNWRQKSELVGWYVIPLVGAAAVVKRKLVRFNKSRISSVHSDLFSCAYPEFVERGVGVRV